MKDIPRWRIALVATALVVLGALGAGLVLANDPADPTPATGSGTTPTAADDGGGLGLLGLGLLGRGDPGAGPSGGTGARPNARPGLIRHGQRLQRLIHVEATLDLPDKGIVTVGVDHGTIASIGSGTIAVSEKNGQTVTLTTSDETKVRKGGAAATLGDLKVGDEVIVTSRLESGAFAAYRIIVPPPAAAPGSTP